MLVYIGNTAPGIRNTRFVPPYLFNIHSFLLVLLLYSLYIRSLRVVTRDSEQRSQPSIHPSIHPDWLTRRSEMSSESECRCTMQRSYCNVLYLYSNARPIQDATCALNIDRICWRMCRQCSMLFSIIFIPVVGVPIIHSVGYITQYTSVNSSALLYTRWECKYRLVTFECSKYSSTAHTISSVFSLFLDPSVEDLVASSSRTISCPLKEKV